MKLKFTGTAWHYFWMTIGTSLLVVCTAGIALPIFVWFQAKYFIEHTEAYTENKSIEMK